MFTEICFAIFMLGECLYLWHVSKRIEDLLYELEGLSRIRRRRN